MKRIARLSAAAAAILVIEGSGASGSPSSPTQLEHIEEQYAGPIVISQGGTYSGNWQSTSDSVPAVNITASNATIVIENCYLMGPSVKIAQAFNARNNKITVRNCVAQGTIPSIGGHYAGRFILMNPGPASLTVENNTIKNTSGILIAGGGAGGITIRYNKALDIHGRHSNGAGGYKAGPARALVQFVQLANVHSASIEIAWNQIVNEPGNSAVEDNISMAGSGGTSTSLATVHDNYVQWGGTAAPLTDGNFNGSCFQNDQGPSGADTATSATQFVSWQANTCVGGQLGMDIAAGHDITVTNNKLVSSGLIAPNAYEAGGTQAEKSQQVGIAIFNYYAQSFFANNVAANNQVAYWNTFDGRLANQYLQSGCASCSISGTTPPNGWASTYRPTLTDEANEFATWQAKLQANGISVGSTLPGG